MLTRTRLTFLLVWSNSNKFSHESFKLPFHSAICGASTWPVPISWSAVALTVSTRSAPIARVSSAKRSKRSSNIWILSKSWPMSSELATNSRSAIHDSRSCTSRLNWNSLRFSSNFPCRSFARSRSVAYSSSSFDCVASIRSLKNVFKKLR